MDDLPLQKISIYGPTLASIIQRFSSSPGDIDGLLFGHVTHLTPSNLPDDDPTDSSSTRSDSAAVVATVTAHFCSSTTMSFYDSLGRLDSAALRRSLGDHHLPGFSLLGWFSGRRRTHLRPSMREFAVSSALSKTLTLKPPDDPNPRVFILFSTPFLDQIVHTHEYRAFEYRKRSDGALEPRSLDVINIGPGFRTHYGAFCPNSQFPWLPCTSNAAEEEIGGDELRSKESLNRMRRGSVDQRVLDSCAEGFDVARLTRLMSSEAANYTSEVEDLYGKMLGKLEGLSSLVEKSSTRVLEQENRNIRLRCRVAGLE